jgi:hypothetical protein
MTSIARGNETDIIIMRNYVVRSYLIFFWCQRLPRNIVNVTDEFLAYLYHSPVAPLSGRGNPPGNVMFAELHMRKTGNLFYFYAISALSRKRIIVCVCVCVCVRVCVRACVRVCVRARAHYQPGIKSGWTPTDDTSHKCMPLARTRVCM